VSHPQQRRFLALATELLLPASNGLKILEVGSYSVNGSARELFPGSEYVGADLCEGPGVDIVSSGHTLTFDDAHFDVALSMECFEHNPHWEATFLNMHRMTKHDGVVIVTCASRGRVEHGTSRSTPGSSPGTHAIGSEYYRNLRPCDFERFQLGDLFSRWHISTIGTDLYFIGWKGAHPDLATFRSRLPSIREQQPLSLALYYLPVSFAALLLPESRFQDFALGYMQRTALLRRTGGRLLRRFRPI
jgi:SAM-dependent methyltransferase